MKARSIGLLCEDYINDKVINVDIFEKSNEVFEGIDPALIDCIYSSKEGLDFILVYPLERRLTQR